MAGNTLSASLQMYDNFTSVLNKANSGLQRTASEVSQFKAKVEQPLNTSAMSEFAAKMGTGFKSAVNDARQLTAAATKIDSPLDAATQSAMQLKNQFEASQNKVRRTAAALDEAKANMSKLEQSGSASASEMLKASNEVDQLESALNGAQRNAQQLGLKFSQSAVQAQKLQQEVEQSSHGVTGLLNRVASGGGAFSGLAAKALQVKKNVMQMDSNFGGDFNRESNEAGNGLDQLSSKVSKTGSLFKTMLGSQIIGNAITSGISAIGRGVAGLVTDLSQASATWQTFTGNMKQLGKSSGEIKKVKGELQDFAEKTIYSSSDMASTYSQLAAVGTKNTTKLVKGFGGLAAAAEDPQQAMKTLSQQATQMAAKPQVAWADFKLMLEQSPAGMAAVAKTMGMSTSEMIKNIQDGKIATEDFFNAVAKTGTNANFSKMATQFKTVGQAVQGVREMIVNKLQSAFDSASKKGIGMVVAIGKAIESIDLGAILDGAVSVFNTMGNIVKKFWKSLNNTGAISALGKAFNDLKKGIQNVVDAYQKSSKAGGFDAIRASAEIWGVQLNIVAGIISGVGKALSSLPTGVLKVIEGLAVSGGTAFVAWKVIGKTAIGAATGVKALSGALKGAGKAASLMASHPWITALAIAAVSFTTLYNSSETFRNGINKVLDVVGKVVQSIGDFIDKNEELSGSLAGFTAVAAITGVMLFGKKLTGLLSPIKTVKNLLTGFGKGGGKGIKELATNTDTAKNSIQSFKSLVGKGLSFTIKAIGVAAVVASLALLAKSMEGIANAGPNATTNMLAFGAVVGMLAGTLATFGTKLQASMVGIGVFAGAVSVMALAMTPLANSSKQGAINMAVFGVVVAGLAGTFALFGAALTTNAVGIGVFAASISAMALAMAPIAQTGTAGAIAMGVFGLVIAGLVMVFALFGTALNVAIPGMIAFGLTALMVGAALALATPFIQALPPVIMALATAFQIVASAIASAVMVIGTTLMMLAQTVGSVIVQIVTAISGGLTQVITAFSDGFAQAVQSVGDAMSQIVTSVADGISQVVTSIGGAISGVLDSLAGVFDSIGTAALNAGKGFKLMASGISQLVALPLGDLGATLLVVGRGVAKIAAAGPGLASAGAGMTMLGAGMQMFSAGMTTAIASMSGFVARINLLVATLPQINAATITAGMAMTMFASTIISSVMSLAVTSMMLQTFVASLMATGAALTAFAAVAGVTGLSVQLLNASMATAAGGSAILRAALAGIKVSLEGIKASAVSAGSSLQNLMTTVNAVKTNLATMKQGADTAIQGVLSAIRNAIEPAKSAGTQVGKGAADGLTKGIKGGRGEAVNALKSIISSLKDLGGSASSAMQSVGSRIGQGLAKGIRSQVGNVSAAADELVAQAERAARAKAKIHSPSRLFRDEVGYYLGAGVAEGINHSAANVADSSEKLISGAVKASSGYQLADVSAGKMAGLELPSLDASNPAKGLVDSFRQAVDEISTMLISLPSQFGLNTQLNANSYEGRLATEGGSINVDPRLYGQNTSSITNTSEERSTIIKIESGAVQINTTGDVADGEEIAKHLEQYLMKREKADLRHR